MWFLDLITYAYYIFFVLFMIATVIAAVFEYKEYGTTDPTKKKLEELDKKISYIAKRCGYKEEENNNDNI